ncbi:putative DNA-binding domain-containing protein [Hyphomonas sp.]|uniref:HvfC/BufC family peptide modification chaperone n=1 Tax=Hyphomonas sp. TaxID=87 RepID=UPI0035676BFA
MRLEQHIEAMSSFAAGGASAAALTPLMEGGAHPGQRAQVYRNSGILACVEALISNNLRLAAVMGDEFFSALARAYADAEPPSTRSLVGYGVSLAHFVAAAESEHGLPWLADIARMDRGWLNAHLAPDADPLAPGALAEIDGLTLMTSTLTAHPSLNIVDTEWAAASLWTDLKSGKLPNRQMTLAHRSEHVLFWRPGGEVGMRALNPGEHAFLNSAMSQSPLGDACEAALAAEPSIDLSHLIAGAVSSGLFITIAQQGGANHDTHSEAAGWL